MNKRISTADITQKRMLSEKEAQTYTGLGRTGIKKFGEEIGCIVRFGRRILYDKNVIDAYFDTLSRR